MGFIEKNIYVLEKRYVIPIDYKMGSNAVPIVFNFQDYDIPEGSTAKYFAGKPSGKATYNTADISGNKVTIRPNTQTFSEPGKYYLHVKVTKGSTELITFNYPVMVEENPISGDIPESENQSDFIEAIVREYEVAKEELKVYSAEVKVATQQAQNAIEDARAVTEQITKDSYLHTTLESFINEVTATPTAYGNALVEKIEGYIRQNKTNGYQLFDASKIASKTQGGATATNNGDGSFTVSGSGTLSDNFSISYTYLKDESLQIISTPGVYKFSEKYNVNSIPSIMWGLYDKNGSPVIGKRLYGGTVSSIEITDEDIQKLETEEYSLRMFVFGSNGSKIIPGTIKPMIYVNGDGTWEPFTGGEPAPSPDYIQTIHGVGDMGFFDGELLQGSYSTSTGQYVTSQNYVCNKNKIPCKENDVISILVDGENLSDNAIIFYDRSYSLISTSYALNATAPQNTFYFNFRIGRTTGITPQSVKHISVTINGMYAICVKSVGKNLLGGSAFMEKLMSIGGTNDKNDIVSISASSLTSKTLYDSFKPNTRYTFILDGYNTNNDRNVANLKIIYTDSSADEFKLGETSSIRGKTLLVSKPDKSIEKMVGIWNTGDSVFYTDTCGIFEGELELDDFINYQGNTIYIPISFPIFEVDQIIKQNGEYKLRRKWGMVVFDGSEDEKWALFRENTNNIWFYISISDLGKRSKTSLYTDRFRFSDYDLSDDDVEATTALGIGTSLPFAVLKSRLNTPDVSGFKTWLQSNPVTVVYELAEPTEEAISSEAQKAIHSIMACDELTNLEIVGVPSDAEVQNQFLLPRNVDGALNTTAYATAKRNEITIAEQESSLQSRLQAIEAQILQEV